MHFGFTSPESNVDERERESERERVLLAVVKSDFKSPQAQHFYIFAEDRETERESMLREIRSGINSRFSVIVYVEHEVVEKSFNTRGIKLSVLRNVMNLECEK